MQIRLGLWKTDEGSDSLDSGNGNGEDCTEGSHAVLSGAREAGILPGNTDVIHEQA